MAKGLVDEQYLTDIANSIRAKNGTTNTYKPSEMSTAIDNISTKAKPDFVSFSSYDGTSLDLSWLDTSSVTNMKNMFNNCASLTSLDLSGFDTSSVTTMQLMFSNCASLTSLDLSGFDTSSVTSMSNMFSNCKSLTSLDLSSFDTSSVTSMTSMFYNCGINNSSPTIVYVKDAATQQKVLDSSGHPSNWSTSNVIIKEVS